MSPHGGGRQTEQVHETDYQNPRRDLFMQKATLAYFLGLAIWVALSSLLINQLVMCCLSFRLPLSLSEVSDKPSETGGHSDN